MLLKGRLVRNKHTVRMSIIIPTFYDSRECDAEYCLRGAYTGKGGTTAPHAADLR
jgi:hypothetical protein